MYLQGSAPLEYLVEYMESFIDCKVDSTSHEDCDDILQPTTEQSSNNQQQQQQQRQQQRQQQQQQKQQQRWDHVRELYMDEEHYE